MKTPGTRGTRRPPKRPTEQRESAHRRGYTRRWRKASKLFLQEHPLCVECEGKGELVPADCVDHIKPHRGDEELFWGEENWQALCNVCHARKTARGQ